MSDKDIWPEWDREDDPGLWDFYAEAYLEPGWAGPLTEPQVRYIRDVLQKKRPVPEGMRSRLRHWWGFTGQGVASEAAIKAVAMYGDPDDPDYNAELVRRVRGLPRKLISEPGPLAHSTFNGTTPLEGNRMPADTDHVFKVAWRQKREPTSDSPSPWWSVDTDGPLHASLDEARKICEKVNAKWNGSKEQWPIEVDLSSSKVVADHRPPVGPPELDSEALKVPVTSASGQ